MDDRQAMFFICDEVLVALNGKYTISGLYTGDITVPQVPMQIPQLVAMFEIKTAIDNPFKSLILQVSIPGEIAPRQLDLSAAVQAGQAMPVIPGRTMAIYRFPFLIQGLILQSGPIEAKVICEDGEILAGTQWVSTAAEMQA